MTHYRRRENNLFFFPLSPPFYSFLLFFHIAFPSRLFVCPVVIPIPSHHSFLYAKILSPRSSVPLFFLDVYLLLSFLMWLSGKLLLVLASEVILGPCIWDSGPYFTLWRIWEPSESPFFSICSLPSYITYLRILRMEDHLPFLRVLASVSWVSPENESNWLPFQLWL